MQRDATTIVVALALCLRLRTAATQAAMHVHVAVLLRIVGRRQLTVSERHAPVVATATTAATAAPFGSTKSSATYLRETRPPLVESIGKLGLSERVKSSERAAAVCLIPFFTSKAHTASIRLSTERQRFAPDLSGCT